LTFAVSEVFCLKLLVSFFCEELLSRITITF